MVKTEPGFSLVEVIVAMTLLSIGTLAVAGTGFIAAATFTRAEMQERVLREAENVLDSVVALQASAAGTRRLRGGALSWSASDSAGTVTMQVSTSGRPPFQISAVR
jgi:prepilin-type N-terminal cleavage/methylation domain-containing protein